MKKNLHTKKFILYLEYIFIHKYIRIFTLLKADYISKRFKLQEIRNDVLIFKLRYIFYSS